MIGKAIGVELLTDCRVFGLALLVVFDHPLDSGTVAEPILPGGRWNARQCRRTIQLYGAISFVGLEHRFDYYGQLAGFRCFVHLLQGERIDLFIPEMKFHQPPAPGRPIPEVIVKGDTGEFPFEVEPVLLPIGGIVEDGVDIMEDIEAGDRLVLVMALKLFQCPVGDIVSACALPVVMVEGEALGIAVEVVIHQTF